MSVLNIKDKITLHILPYKFNKEGTKIQIFDGDKREKMLAYIENLSDIIQDDDELAHFFQGWAWCHRWIAVPPENYDDIGDYNASGNLNLLLCAAHHSQSKEVFKTLYNEEIALAKEYSEKVNRLQKMPV